MSWKIGWGFTSLCNMNCQFCYSRNHRSKNHKKYSDIEKSLSFIQFNKDKIEAINYGTGENVLDSQWWLFIAKLKEIESNIIQGVTTNGSLAIEIEKNSKRIDILKEVINDVDISIDYPSSYYHNLARGHKKAFQWALESIKLCEELNIETTIVMVATNDTFSIDNIKKMVDFVSKFRINLRINIYRPVTSFNHNYLLSPHLLFSGLSFLLKYMDVVSISDPLLSSLLGEKKYQGDFTAKSSFRILEDGFICPSTYLITNDWKSINIYNDTVFDIDNLHHISSFSRLINSSIPKKCQQCNFKKYCRGGAFDRRLLWYNSLDIPDPYCPFYPYTNESINIDEIGLTSPNYCSNKGKANLVHDGYLPTIIFSSKQC